MVVSGNISTNGGGVVVFGTGVPGSKVTISNSLITKNTSGQFGGGIDILQVASVSIKRSVVTGNTATTQKGGGIYARIEANGTGLSINNSTISGNTASVGGGIFVLSYNPSPKVKATISNSTINSNTSTNAGASGGGGVATGTGNIVIKNSTLRDNTAVQDGGGIFATNFTSLNIIGGTISGNQTTDFVGGYFGGGGVCILGTGSGTPLPATIKGTHITDNTAAQDGGGLIVHNGISLTMSSAVVNGNPLSPPEGASEFLDWRQQSRSKHPRRTFSDNQSLGNRWRRSCGRYRW